MIMFFQSSKCLIIFKKGYCMSNAAIIISNQCTGFPAIPHWHEEVTGRCADDRLL